MNNTRYTFGNTVSAAKRLEMISGFFNPLAQDWIARHSKNTVDTAVDLGCGPGYSTDMLRRAVNPSKTYGFEKSDEFLEMAKERYTGLFFIKHDVTANPFPVRADIMYCRFLLSHLEDAETLVNAWTEELTPGGMLFIDEVEGINTDVPVFRQYLEINEGLVRSQRAKLFVGETLSKGRYKARVVENELARIPVASWRAASWFHPNTVTVWEKEKYVLDSYPAGARRAVSGTIRHIMNSRDASVKTLWKMRRIVLWKR